MKRLIFLQLFLLFSCQLIAQTTFNGLSDVISFMENKVYYNQETDIDLEFGQISSLNTFGITIKSNGTNRINYFINCDIRGYYAYADVSGISPKDGSSFKFRLFPDRIIVGIGESKQAVFTEKRGSGTKLSNDINFYLGTFMFPENNLKVVVSKENNRLKAVVYRNNQIVKFKTTCGEISEWSQVGDPEFDGAEIKTGLIPSGCSEPIDPLKGRPNYITLGKGDGSTYFPNNPEFRYHYLQISIKNRDLCIELMGNEYASVTADVKKVRY
jgi:hypothetical protein